MAFVTIQVNCKSFIFFSSLFHSCVCVFFFLLSACLMMHVSKTPHLPLSQRVLFLFVFVSGFTRVVLLYTHVHAV